MAVCLREHTEILAISNVVTPTGPANQLFHF